MRTLLAAIVCSMLAVAVGCNKDNDMNGNDKMMKSDSSMMKDKNMASMDACSHCAGKQTATAAGTCPVCGMKVTGGGNSK